MYQKYHDSLVHMLSTNTSAACEKYFGELRTPESGDFAKGSLPIIYIDFIQDDTSKARIIDIEFSLYIVHMSYSKNKLTRAAAQNEVHALLKEIYKCLSFQCIEDSQPIELKKLKKIFDANAAGGYLSVYQKELFMSIPNPILTGGI
jgi:hypothetical protein